MTYTVIDHGLWKPYTPDILPDDCPPGALFLKRESDGLDWYSYSWNGATWQPDSVKVTCLPGSSGLLTQAIVRDERSIFPANCRVIEVLGVDPTVEKPHRLFEHQLFDLASQSFGAIPKPPVLSVSKAQGKLALLDAGLLDMVDVAVANGTRQSQIWYADANDWYRNDPNIAALASGLGLSDTTVDALFEAASKK